MQLLQAFKKKVLCLFDTYVNANHTNDVCLFNSTMTFFEFSNFTGHLFTEKASASLLEHLSCVKRLMSMHVCVCVCVCVCLYVYICRSVDD